VVVVVVGAMVAVVVLVVFARPLPACLLEAEPPQNPPSPLTRYLPTQLQLERVDLAEEMLLLAQMALIRFLLLLPL
jgi:hypothetical protein